MIMAMKEGSEHTLSPTDVCVPRREEVEEDGCSIYRELVAWLEKPGMFTWSELLSKFSFPWSFHRKRDTTKIHRKSKEEPS